MHRLIAAFRYNFVILFSFFEYTNDIYWCNERLIRYLVIRSETQLTDDVLLSRVHSPTMPNRVGRKYILYTVAWM